MLCIQSSSSNHNWYSQTSSAAVNIADTRSTKHLQYSDISAMQVFKISHLTKKSYCLVIVSLLFVIFYSINTQHNFKEYLPKAFKEPATITSPPQEVAPTKLDIKYILLWTSNKNSPFYYFREGRTVFVNKNCTYNNCYVTGDRGFLGDYTEFELVAFNGPQLSHIRYLNDLPERRHYKQKYVFANIESAGTYPICNKVWDNYFNWTWTYKLDSSAVWGYFVIKDMNKNIIGPKRDMHWMKIDDMEPIDKSLKLELSTKTKAALWFVSNCNTNSLREDFVEKIQEHLRDFNLDVDIYGECGTLQCPKSIMQRCLRMIARKYFFYFAFENSISEDYVTEKILNALNNNAVPVVFGGANYTRFMPKGIYLDARELGPKKLAEAMFRIIHDSASYHKFFRWKKYYSYHYTHEAPETDVYCQFCAILNNDSLVQTRTVFNNFKDWWTPKNYCNDFYTVTLH